MINLYFALEIPLNLIGVDIIKKNYIDAKRQFNQQFQKKVLIKQSSYIDN